MALPNAGDNFMVFPNLAQAKEIAELRLASLKSKLADNAPIPTLSLDNTKVQHLNCIIKADSQGSAEAIRNSLLSLNTDLISIDILAYQAGAVTENDVVLASSASAIIYAFNVRPDSNVVSRAKSEKVEIKNFRIIYDVVEDMKEVIKGSKAPEYVSAQVGVVEIRKTYTVSKLGTIAGCKVTEGHVKKGLKVTLVRGGVEIVTTTISSLKINKDEVREVKNGFECGIMLEDYNDILVDDILLVYESRLVDEV
jgi:translation initiation factor IF-2